MSVYYADYGIIKHVPRDLVTLEQAAKELKVSPRRARAMVQSGLLQAEKFGNRWAVTIDALDHAANNLTGLAGRPFSESTSWRIIQDGLAKQKGLDSKEIDRLRRRLRTRAKHCDYYTHPGVAKRAELDPRVVVGGQVAAIAAGAPIDDSGSRDFYIREDELGSFVSEYSLRAVATGANLHLHVVNVNDWPFESGCHLADPFVAWLDLADRSERSATTLLDRLVGGRLVARDSASSLSTCSCCTEFDPCQGLPSNRIDKGWMSQLSL